MTDRGAQASWGKCPIFSWRTIRAYRAAETTSRSPPWTSRRVALVSRLLTVLSLAPVIGACSPDLSCSGTDVQTALRQALDNVYAQSRTLSQIDLTIKDIVSVGEIERGVSCKAVVHLDINYLGIAKTADPIIPYTAERTDNGQVLVTTIP